MRAFISIKLPPKILRQIKEIQDRLPNFIGKKTELKNLHLTLKFLGELPSDKVEEVKSTLRKINFNKFEADINNIGFFDNSSNGIIWLGITNCDNLQIEVDKSLANMFKKERRFMGHLTIARVKKYQDKRNFIEKIKSIKVSKMFFTIDKFYLMESNLKKDGPEYSIIEEYVLFD